MKYRSIYLKEKDSVVDFKLIKSKETRNQKEGYITYLSELRYYMNELFKSCEIRQDILKTKNLSKELILSNIIEMGFLEKNLSELKSKMKEIEEIRELSYL